MNMGKRDREERVAKWAEEIGKVDFELLMSFVKSEMSDTSRAEQLIDRFLELKDLRIEVEEDSEERCDQSIPLAPSPEITRHEMESEELARIYHSQGMFHESKEIYKRLFLLYSEKIAYFATQIETLTQLEAGEEIDK